MDDFWCYIAFLFSLLALLVGVAALSTQLVMSLAFLTVVAALISIVIQVRAAEKNTIALGLSGVAIFFVIVSLYYGFFGQQQRSGGQVDTAMKSMRDLGAAINRYRQDQGQYPLWGSGNQTINFYIIPGQSGWVIQPSFRAWVLPADSGKYRLLTTPTAYLDALPADPFLPAGATFSYYADQGGWILLSPGPDGDYDISPQQFFTSTMPQPNQLLVVRKYDPTNGTKSDGDLFLVSAQMNQ